MNSKINVMYVVSNLRATGPTSQLLNILKNIDVRRFRVKLVTLSGEPDNSMLPEFLKLNIDYETLDLSRVAGVFLTYRLLRKVVSRFRPHVMHSQGIRSDCVCSRLTGEVKTLSTLRNFPQIDYPLEYGRFLGRCMALVHIRALKHLDQIVAVSEGVRSNLLNYGFDNVAVARNGVDSERFFRPTLSMRRAAKESLGLKENCYVFLVSGPLIERKRPLEIMEEFLSVYGQNDEVRLIFVGDGDLMGRCSSLAAQSANVDLVGHVKDVVTYLHAADMLLSASTAEGFPNAVLEALAAGLPVALSDISPHRELLSLAPEAGYIYGFSRGDLRRLFQYCEQKDDRYLLYPPVRANSDLFSDKENSLTYQRIYGEALNI